MRVDFPDHAVIVRQGEAVLAKGVRDRAALEALLDTHTGVLRLETDMRAHLNPTRMGEIARLADDLVSRLATPCPACSQAGFGRTCVERGLPCSTCGTPSELVAREIWTCGGCGYSQARPRADGRITADPGECAVCNP